ncbi:MAG: energy-coupling factor transporter transmembrane protein EcfT, partial [Chloroflexi bacterium]|nr:energy-coupling factor transporter transmembrane protein EcfT [Chloroflexota bacterium]
MSVVFDLYVARDSWLHRLDPRVKLLAVLGGTLLILSWISLALCLLALALLHLLLWSARVPASKLRWAWATLLPITVLIPLLWPLFSHEPGPTLLAWGPLQITTPSLVRGLAMAARVDALAFLYFAWLFTTSQSKLVRSFVRLGLPYEWGLMVAISLRYLPTFYGTYLSVRDAQQARGLILGAGGPLQRLRAFMPIMVAVVIQALRATENLSRALEARGFGGAHCRTALHDLHMA